MNQWYLIQFKPNSHRLAERNLHRQGFKVLLRKFCAVKRLLSSFQATQPAPQIVEGTESGRELAFADHVRDFDAIKRCRCRFERLEPQHWSDQPFDEAVILLDNVVQVFAPHHFNWNGTTETLQHSVNGFDACSVRAAFVDHNLTRETVEL